MHETRNADPPCPGETWAQTPWIRDRNRSDSTRIDRQRCVTVRGCQAFRLSVSVRQIGNKADSTPEATSPGPPVFQEPKQRITCHTFEYAGYSMFIALTLGMIVFRGMRTPLAFLLWLAWVIPIGLTGLTD